ncbi:hypothetical protein [Streptomyces poriticola]
MPDSLVGEVVDRRCPISWWMERTGSAEFHQRGGAAFIDLHNTI